LKLLTVFNLFITPGIMLQASTTLFEKKLSQIRRFKYIVQSLFSRMPGRIFSGKQQSLNKQTDHLPELHILMLTVYRGESRGRQKFFRKTKTN
jgi:hypothetical protein